MGAKVVHKQVVSVIDKEMQRIDHLSVIPYQGHFNGLFDDFYDCSFGFSLLL